MKRKGLFGTPERIRTSDLLLRRRRDGLFSLLSFCPLLCVCSNLGNLLSLDQASKCCLRTGF
jgi:hypothetical protein